MAGTPTEILFGAPPTNSVGSALPSAGMSPTESLFTNNPAGPSTAGEAPAERHEFTETPTPWGWAANLIGDVPEMLGGLKDLTKMAVGDIAGGITQLIPGEQGGIERGIEEHGYALPEMGKALIGYGDRPSALLKDYADRYGGHGIEETAWQVYNNPLSYVMDALMVADAGSTSASMLAKVLPESEGVAKFATAMRGVTPEAEALAKASGEGKLHPSTTVGNLMQTAKPVIDPATGEASATMGAAAGVTSFDLSLNPIKRILQNKIISHVMTTSAEEAAGRLASGTSILGTSKNLPGTIGTAEQAIVNAADKGIGVLRPTFEKFIAKSAMKKLYGISTSKFYAGRDQMLLEMKDILEPLEKGPLSKDALKAAAETGVEPVTDTTQQLNQGIAMTEQALERTHDGMVVPTNTGLPADGPIAVDLTGQNVLDPASYSMDPMNQPAVAPVGDQGVPGMSVPEVHEIMVKSGASLDHSPTPFRPDGYGLGELSYHQPVAGYDNIGAEIDRMGQNLGAAPGHTVLNTLDGASHDVYRGIEATYDTQWGKVRVNFADPVLKESQGVYGDIAKRLPKVNDLMSETERALAGMSPLDPETAARVAADASAMADEEVRAGMAQMKRSMQVAMRRLNNPEGYDPILEAVDKMYLWEYKWGAKHYLDGHPTDWLEKGMDGPFVTLAKRAYAPMRHQIWHSDMREMEKEIYRTFKANPGAHPAQLRPLVADILDKHGVPRGEYLADGTYVPGVQDDVLKMFPTRLSPNRTANGKWIRSGPRIIADRVRTGTYNKWVVNAEDHYGWEAFHEATPQLPGYYPHIRAMKKSDLLSKVGSVIAHGPDDVAFSKGWKGTLMENGTYIKDPKQVYARLGSAYLRQQEIGDLIRNTIPLGRELTETEKELYMRAPEQFANGAEVFWAPDTVLRRLNIQGDIMESIANNMDRGMSYDEATAQAVKSVGDLIQSGVIEDMKGAKVYAIPRHVADQMSQVVSKKYGAAIRMFYDGPMNVWRSTVLGLNPRWMLYNAMGNVIFTGIKNPKALRRIFGDMTENNRKYVESVLAEYRGEGSLAELGAGNYATQGQLLDRHLGMAEEVFPKTAQRSQQVLDSKAAWLPRKITQTIRNKNSMIEYAARRGIALDQYAIDRSWGWTRALQSNMDIANDMLKNGLTEPQFNKMLAGANKVLGDYTTLSPVERDVVRRYLMPFYPFYRHVLKFTARMPWENPVKSSVFRLLAEMDKDMQSELPEYLQGSINVGQIGGLPAYWNVQNFNPMSNFTGNNASMLGMLNPFVKVAIQGQLGVDDFGEKFDEPNLYEAGNGMRFIHTAEGWVPYEGQSHDPYWSMALQQFGTPFNFLNLPGYKNPTLTTKALGVAGVSLSRFDTAKYQENELAGEMEALLHGNQ